MKFLLLLLPLLLQALTFKVATYNVENLFDTHFSGNEYVEYIPGSKFGWSDRIYRKKLQNISKVIFDLNADILALEEIESKKALLDLREVLKKRGIFYRYYAIADKKDTTVKVALLSKFKIAKKSDLAVTYSKRYRDILEAHIDIKDHPLIIFVNHWKSKSGSESERIMSAKVLKKRISKIPKNREYIVLGDFNSNYNEFITFANNKKLNDTHGKTGINNILKTVKDGSFVTINEVKEDCSLLYNLWLELPKALRYSYIYRGEKNSIDNILLPCSMFDGRGIEYIKNSFGVFKKSYLFKNGTIFRWQRAYGYGKFTGLGYSDHLPLFAYFTTDKNHPSFNKVSDKSPFETKSISYLYQIKYLKKPVSIKNAAVIYRDKTGVVIKREDDRAIYIFGHNRVFKIGYSYDIIVKSIKRYRGNLEIDKIADAFRDKKVNIKDLFLHYKRGMDLSKKRYLNEVIFRLKGRYEKGFLYYDNKRIRIYNKIKNFRIKDGATVTLKKVRVVTYKAHPEIILYYKRQIR